MGAVSFYFQMHQPRRLKKYSFFELGKDHNYFDDGLNKEVVDKVATNCYVPMGQLFLELFHQTNGAFKVNVSVSGILLEQLEEHRKDVIKLYQELADIGCIEFLAETYYHSLSFFYSKKQFDLQVKKHGKLIRTMFGQKPAVFRNTELVYNSDLTVYLESLGYKAVMAEGVDWYLNGRSPNGVFKSSRSVKIKTLLRNYQLSDEIAFRFNTAINKDTQIDANTFCGWLKLEDGHCVNLGMDIETFGEHYQSSTGIFRFFRSLVLSLVDEKMKIKTFKELLRIRHEPEVYDVEHPTSWADTERDLSAWRGNAMQKESLTKLYAMEVQVLKSKNPALIHDWNSLQTSDHFYYMSTKSFNDANIHSFFSPFESPYDAYIAFMNVLADLELRMRMKSK